MVDQVGGMVIQQQVVVECYGVGIDYLLQLLCVDFQCMFYVMQGDEDDGGVQGDDQLGSGQQGQCLVWVFEGRY